MVEVVVLDRKQQSSRWWKKRNEGRRKKDIRLRYVKCQISEAKTPDFAGSRCLTRQLGLSWASALLPEKRRIKSAKHM